jgi:hypothetical protein
MTDPVSIAYLTEPLVFPESYSGTCSFIAFTVSSGRSTNPAVEAVKTVFISV